MIRRGPGIVAFASWLAVVMTSVSTFAQDNDGRGLSINPLSTLQLDTLAATRDRPLFAPSRSKPPPPPPPEPERPPPEPKTPPPPPPPEPLHFRLVGVVIDKSGGIALLKDEQSGEIHRVRQGEDLQGWTLKSVVARSVELTREDQTTALRLFVAKGEPGRAYDQPFSQRNGDVPDENLDENR